MVFKEQIINLHSGQACLIRTPEVSNAQELLDYLKKTAAETPFMIRNPDEVRMSVEEEIAFLTSVQNSKTDFMISAFVEGKLVANCGVAAIAIMRKEKHRATVGIAVLQEYWKEGIATALLTYAVEKATEVGYKQIELEVVSTNEHAISLYKNLGFEIYATRRNTFHLDDGTFLDCHLMLKTLTNGA